LRVNPRTVRTQTVTLCPSSSLKIGNNTYTRTGTYQDSLKSIFGCDSIITTILTIQPIVARTQDVSLCLGQSVKVGGKTYTQTGVYQDTLKTRVGCDSIVTTNLTINTVILKSQNLTICEGDSVKVGTRMYNKTGVFKDTLKALGGCDSIITTSVKTLPLFVKQIDTTICGNKKLVINGKTYSESGVYTEQLNGANKCDGILQILLTVQPLSVKRNDITLCPNDTIFINGKALRLAGVYRDTISSATGCPQIVESFVQNSPLRISAGADVTIEIGDSARLSLGIPTNPNILWKWKANKALSCVNCPNPIAKPLETTTFSVEAKDTVSNCTVKDDIRVVVKSCASMFAPTSFSPNGDGRNDYFTLFASGCVQKVKKMLVFNRWGALVFSKENFTPNNEQDGWDGSFSGNPLASDVYTYLFELELNTGKTEKIWGDVTLMK
jgi:gliding motility-associated-like protein